jgi:hypothetical protein
MSEYRAGGIVPGSSTPTLIGPEECIIHSDGMCMRSDAGHIAATITESRFWVCPTHD